MIRVTRGREQPYAVLNDRGAIIRFCASITEAAAVHAGACGCADGARIAREELRAAELRKLRAKAAR